MFCPEHGLERFVTFLVDTGASNTTILCPEHLGLDHTKLPIRGTVQTAGGSVNTHSISNVNLIFRIENGDYYNATGNEVDVTPSGLNATRYQLLGMDVTNRFKRFVTERRRPYFEL